MLSLAAGLVALAACKGHDKANQAVVPPLQKVLPNIPLPPQGTALVEQHGTNAVQFIMVSPLPPDSVTDYYRKILSNPPFHIVNETTQRGTTSFYAEQTGPSLWITVAANGDQGSQITIAGASADSVDARLKSLPVPQAKNAPSIPLKSIGG